VSHCPSGLPSCGEVVAWWVHQPSGNWSVVCKECLDAWFDNADDHPPSEPLAWGWFDYRPGVPQPVLLALG
jgi:hypothetical protein